jgi:hypothetical protein
MKYYFAGERVLTREASITAGGGHLQAHKYITNRLLSYYYHGFLDASNAPSKEARESDEAGWHMFLDSGAFTAWTKKKTITCERYAEFIHNSGGMWDVVSALDAIGDPEQTYRNVKRLEQLGCRVQPVFHYDRNPNRTEQRKYEAYLQRYLDEGYDYIFIGGMVGLPRAQLLPWLDHIFETYLCNPDGTAKVKLHGFGLTDMVLARRYPWHSVDSSSWLMTGIFGSCLFWNPATGEPQKVVFSNESPEAKKLDGWHYSTLPPAQRALVDAWLEPMGVTAEQCGQHYSFRDTVNAKFYAELQEHGCDKFIRHDLDLWSTT